MTLVNFTKKHRRRNGGIRRLGLSAQRDVVSATSSELDKGGQMMNGVWYYVYDLEKASKIIENFILENDNDNEQAEQSA